MLKISAANAKQNMSGAANNLNMNSAIILLRICSGQF
jgi:hypothetical protein